MASNMKKFFMLVVCLAISMPVLGGHFEAKKLAAEFARYSLVPDDLRLMKHRVVEQKLHEIAAINPRIILKKVGQSVEGRSLNMLSFGTGETRLLLWSQMHGDEPTATAALLAIFNFLAKNNAHPLVEDIYKHLTVNAIVMLNPDGAEMFQRRNAQDIDINRDARLLQSPEAQTLKRIKDEVKPDFGYNLHNMDGREQVGRSRKLLNIAFMAPPFNYEDENTATRIRAKKLIVRMKEILDQFIPGHMSRYDADFMPRAFGDAMQNWGVSTVLIESALHDDGDPQFLVKMNFIALLGSFDAILSDDLENADEKIYDEIPLEGVPLFDLLIHDVLIYNGAGIPPFRGDIGINIRQTGEADSIVTTGMIADIGDLSVITGGRREIAGNGLTAIPGLVATADSIDNDSLLMSGITTLISMDGDDGKAMIPPEAFILDPLEIQKFTSIPAGLAGKRNTGVLKQGKKADIVLFNDAGDGMFRVDLIKYVIRNGQITARRP